MLALVSILLLYVETSFQVFVVLTSHSLPLSQVPVALTTLAMTFMAFAITSIISLALAHQLTTFQGRLAPKIVFGTLHTCCAGLLWRAFKLVLIFSELDLKHLILLRLVHVSLQSAPYLTFYVRFYTIGSKINVIQAVSLVISTVSSAVALTSFSLSNQLPSYAHEERLVIETQSVRQCVPIMAAAVGTTFIYGVRLVSIALMASQQGFWVFLPLALHFTCMIIICRYRYFHRRKSSSDPLYLQTTYVVGLSWLNILDLVHDNTSLAACSYVGFSSLFLVENIIMLAFWLFGSSVGSVIKLFTFVGILAVFVVGLIVKYAAYNSLPDCLPKPDPHESDCGSCCNTCTTTETSHNIGEEAQNPRGKDYTRGGDHRDLISIIQAAVHGGAQSDTPRDGHTSETSVRRTLRVHTPNAYYCVNDASTTLHFDNCAISHSRGQAMALSNIQHTQSHLASHNIQQTLNTSDMNKRFEDNKDNARQICEVTPSSSLYLHGRNGFHLHQRISQEGSSKDSTSTHVSEILLDPSRINNPRLRTGRGVRPIPQYSSDSPQASACCFHSRSPCSGDICSSCDPHLHSHSACDPSERQHQTIPSYSIPRHPVCGDRFTPQRRIVDSPLSSTLSGEVTYSDLSHSSPAGTQSESNGNFDSRYSSSFTSSSTATVYTNR